MKKIISIKGPYSSENLGDFAMLISTIKILNEIGDFEYNIYTSTIDELLPSLNEDFNKAKNIKLTSSKFKFFNSILKSKLVLYGGGSQIVRKRNPLPLLSTVLFSKIFGKKILIYSVDGNYFSGLYKLAIKLSDGIIFRVPAHYEKSKIFTKKAYLLPDIAVPYFLNIVNSSKRKKGGEKYLCHSSTFFNKNIVYEKRGYKNIQQETMYEKRTTKYFLNLFLKAKKIISFHYHTLLFCHLAKIKSTSLQKNKNKHKSIKYFSVKDYSNTKGEYIKILKNYL